MPRRRLPIILAAPLLAGSLAWPAVARAEAPPPTAAMLAERAAKRFPQPVRVGDLIDRQVLRPTEAQQVLGRVAAVTRAADGGLSVVVRFGGAWGFGARPIAVPIEAVSLLGEHVAIMDFSPDQLRALPTASDHGVVRLAADDIIRVGLAKPFH